MAAKIGKPFYSPTRNDGGWFCKLDGRQVFLGKHPNKSKPNSTKPPQEILDEWMRQATMTVPVERTDYRFAELVAMHLEAKPSKLKESRLTRFCEFRIGPNGTGKRVGDLLVNAELEAAHLEAWLNSVEWSADTRSSYAGDASSVINWAMKRKTLGKVISVNPFKGAELAATKARDVFTTEENHRRLLLFWGVRERDFDSGFCDLLRALWHTGARPGEIYRMTADDVDLKNDVIAYDKHKTDDKTGETRFIPIVPELREILVRRMEQYPTGLLFRGRTGQRWNDKAMYERFKRAREAGVIPEEVIPYAYRHGLATEAGIQGMDLYAIAKLLGHASIRTTRRYDKSRRNTAHLVELANRVRKPK